MLGGQDIGSLTVAQSMEDEIRLCYPFTKWNVIASTLADGGFGSLPVVDADGNLQGMVSEYDLLKVIIDGGNEKNMTAQEVMNAKPLTVKEDTPMLDAVKLLEDHHLARAPVVNGQKLVGMLTLRDLLFCYLQAKNEPPHGY